MDRQEFEALIVKINMFAAGLNQMGDRLIKESNLSTQHMNHAASSLANIADQTATRVSDQLQQTASRTIAAGANAVVEVLLKQLGNGVGQLNRSIDQLERRVAAADRAHIATAWKGFVGLLTGGLAVIALTAYFSWSAHQTAQRANQQIQWVSLINAAETNGKLAPCPDADGLCALIGKKWVKLD
ncbi:hypothetical protein [Dyella dinghuensis]|nr:hypothetical protein [Dyella dinghuensis]